MEFLSILYQLIFMPLQIIFEVIYYLAFRLIGNPGVSIIALSFVVNLLVLPLYNRADAIQEAERDMEARLSKGVEHIKKTFKGDEQLMILQTYYRQNGYSPLDSIKGSISLFLEIPFFVAAYQFLSHLEILNGASLGPIKDLGAPDGLLTVAGMTINVLPFVMTAVNLISAYIFTKDLTSKTKAQLYGMACFFLVFLYASPAGLVFYWTLNNIFNLIKTIVYKLENVDRGINIVFGVLGIIVIIFGSIFFSNGNINKIIWYVIIALALNARLIFRLLGKRRLQCKLNGNDEYVSNKFYVGTMFLAILVGALIPSAVIESAPREFLLDGYFSNPLWYVVSSFSIALGTFVFWGGIFYWIAEKRYKVKFERVIFCTSGIAIINYMFFNRSFGVLSNTLCYEKNVGFSGLQKSTNAIIIILVIVALNFVWKKYNKNIIELLMIGIIALSGMTIFNVYSIQKSIIDSDDKISVAENNQKNISLSRKGKNIIVVMLDRAAGEYIPYLFNEKSELKEKFAGFTYYPNVISHGSHTIFGAPGIFGGYEYTPAEMNKRDKETLVQKHNEANKVLPELFRKAGYNVLSGNSYAEETVVVDKETAKEIIVLNNRNFYFHGVLKVSPILMQKFLYDNGDYLSGKAFNQEIKSLNMAFGINKDFIKEYKSLDALLKISKVSNEGNNFLSFVNNITHTPCLLQMPQYEPSSIVDNSSYDNRVKNGFGNEQIMMDNKTQMSHYHVNMAAMLKLAEWFEFMRVNDVYDNTRIILVSDHGYPLQHFKELVLSSNSQNKSENIEWYYPLLLVKDFNSKKFSVSEEFMTNADVPSIAVEGIIDEPINPFTGNVIGNKAKYESVQYVFASHAHSLSKNDKNTYVPGPWYSVHSDMRNKDNWKLVQEEAMLPY